MKKMIALAGLALSSSVAFAETPAATDVALTNTDFEAAIECCWTGNNASACSTPAVCSMSVPSSSWDTSGGGTGSDASARPSVGTTTTSGAKVCYSMHFVNLSFADANGGVSCDKFSQGG